MKKSFIIVIVIIFLFLISIGVYLYLFKKPNQISLENQQKIAHSPCLKENETATYKINENKNGPSSVDIIISDKKDDRKVFKFQINNIFINYHPIELRKCGVYVIRQFNFDYQIQKGLPNYRDEIWRYFYNEKGEAVVLLSEKDNSGNFQPFFSLDFRVDPLEIYIALEQYKTYSGESLYALVIRNFVENLNSFTLRYVDLLNQYPSLSGLFGLKDWTKNGSYFWGNIFDGAIINAFIQITRDTWLVNIFKAPDGTLGGTAFNPEYGYITYDTGPGWIGIDIVAEQIYEEWRKEGKKVEFYLYNLFTKEKTLLAVSDDPSYWAEPNWISDTELEYYLPTGEKKIYKLHEN